MLPIVLGLLVALALAIGIYFAFGRKKPTTAAKGTLESTKPVGAAAKPLPAPQTVRADTASSVGAAGSANKPEADARAPSTAAVVSAATTAADRPTPFLPPALATEPVQAAAKPSAPQKASTSATSAELKSGLTATRKGFMARLADLLVGRKELDPGLVAELEEVLLSSDVGPKTTEVLLARLRERLDRNALKDNDAVWAALREEARAILTRGASGERSGGLKATHTPTVVLMVGVNGVGKTTTIGKLATKLAASKQTLLLGAGDTFRAAAVAQLEVWGKRVGVEVIRGKDGADPASVAFEATARAKADGVQFLLMDTAGRLHTKAPLMDEIKKVRKSMAKALDGAPHETLLVLDATTGQNALNQAALFKEAVDLTGIVLTKLDGTAKGGIVLAIAEELNVPVRYIGLGEKAEDLREFDATDFVDALFSRSDDAS
jgi:fused signal recognition particle receptor